MKITILKAQFILNSNPMKFVRYIVYRSIDKNTTFASAKLL